MSRKISKIGSYSGSNVDIRIEDSYADKLMKTRLMNNQPNPSRDNNICFNKDSTQTIKILLTDSMFENNFQMFVGKVNIL